MAIYCSVLRGNSIDNKSLALIASHITHRENFENKGQTLRITDGLFQAKRGQNTSKLETRTYNTNKSRLCATFTEKS